MNHGSASLVIYTDHILASQFAGYDGGNEERGSESEVAARPRTVAKIGYR